MSIINHKLSPFLKQDPITNVDGEGEIVTEEQAIPEEQHNISKEKTKEFINSHVFQSMKNIVSSLFYHSFDSDITVIGQGLESQNIQLGQIFGERTLNQGPDEQMNITQGFDPIGLDYSKDGLGSHELMSFSQYMNLALFGDFGFYTSDHTTLGADFSSVNASSYPQKFYPFFGAFIGEVAHQTYLEIAEPGAPFVIREDGGGHGELARGALIYLDTMAMINYSSSYADMYADLKYVGVDISLDAVNHQIKDYDNSVSMGLVREGVFTAMQGDATNFITKRGHGFAVSNEMIDAFPVHRFFIDAKGNTQMVFPIPYISDSANLEQVWPQESDQMITESNLLVKKYGLPSEERTYLTASRFGQYQIWLAKHEQENNVVDPLYEPHFIEGLVDVEKIPGVREAIEQRKADLIPSSDEVDSDQQKEVYLDLEASRYFHCISESFEQGRLLVIDYMNTGGTQLRTYDSNAAIPEYGQTAHVYEHFGRKDLTRNPDSDQLIKETKLSGFDLIDYRDQADLVNLSNAQDNHLVAQGLMATYYRSSILPKLPTGELRCDFDTWLAGQYKSARTPKAFVRTLQQNIPYVYQKYLTNEEWTKVHETALEFYNEILQNPEQYLGTSQTGTMKFLYGEK